MKTKRLDGRYGANKKYGYTWQVQFASYEWRKYFDFKAQAKSMFGPSEDTVRFYIWREVIVLLRTAPWAYHYEKSSKPSYVYFRTEDQMNQCIMMYALTNA